MKIFSASIAGASLILMAALRAAAQARSEMQEWRMKLHDFGDSAHAEVKEASKVPVDDLNEAWIRTEDALRRLENAGAEDWRSAKASYKAAAHKLTLAWHKVSPTEK